MRLLKRGGVAMSLGLVPDEPNAEEVQNAYWVLVNSWWTAESFLDQFDEQTKSRGPGAPSDQDYDLMRAMLVFSCSGLDSMIKHLITEALPRVIDEVIEAQVKFSKYVKGELDKDKGNDLVADVLTSGNPRGRLVDSLVDSLTSGSLQSKAEVLRAASYFGLEHKTLMPQTAIYDALFQVRNQIVHEMDMDLNRSKIARTKNQNKKRSRTTRPRRDMVPYAQAVLECGSRFLAGVDEKLTSS